MLDKIYAQYAPKYFEKGILTVPIRPGTKAPEGVKWKELISSNQPDLIIKNWIEKYPNYGIGVLMGTKIGDYVLACIDIDHDRYPPIVECFLEDKSLLCRKKGSKGLSIFVKALPTLKNQSFGPDIEGVKNVVEIFTNRKVVTIPPTNHPDTGNPYEWLDTPLYEIDLKNLPVIGE